ncbi:MAG: hypothetical protein QF692_00700 [Alphaproteobacteria bacterium]|jgi:organic hydroperoxide reductase OsmC/OhrA|nr:hypothetical protein [Alphaproteobacteria bacterium]MDP7221761.1 hypothetical protein [Alphaproteobacteria bacterium]
MSDKSDLDRMLSERQIAATPDRLVDDILSATAKLPQREIAANRNDGFWGQMNAVPRRAIAASVAACFLLVMVALQFQGTAPQATPQATSSATQMAQGAQMIQASQTTQATQTIQATAQQNTQMNTTTNMPSDGQVEELPDDAYEFFYYGDFIEDIAVIAVDA